MDRSTLEHAYRGRLAVLDAAAKALETEVSDALANTQHVDRVSFRAKSATSFVEKVLTRKVDPPYGHPPVEVEDQIPGRVLVFFRGDIEIVRQRLSRILTFAESSHREPAKDAEFG